ncbi:MAC/perforin domain-containing protein [Dictyobacter arantiisoli]|uniref:MACPF domain-containing protein n=1 Tax=Dictyobacter arantiisoli TaxID=2014874 RepID=A0A5A5TKH5_9CHLR|nr:MAC/perforin domain-containing protein [Dictyobacter arantiisoli]GCF11765.1 hypothetical protein KDI_53290 [Dictyobacter arantiisoli]
MLFSDQNPLQDTDTTNTTDNSDAINNDNDLIDAGEASYTDANTDSGTPVLSQVGFVGQGFNIFGPRDLTDGLITPLLDFTDADTYTFTLIGKDYLVPTGIEAIQNTQGYAESGVFLSREGFQNNIAAHLGVSASAGAFSGEMQADYAGEFSANSQYMYAYTIIHYPVAVLQLLDYLPYVKGEFAERVTQLPDQVTDDNLSTFSRFFEDFGVYYTDKIVLGGSVELYIAISQSETLSKQSVEALFQAQYEALFETGSLSANTKASVAWQNYSKSARNHTVIKANGGSLTAIQDVQDVDPWNPSTSILAKLQNWSSSVEAHPSVTDFSLKGIWQFCGTKSTAVYEAWQRYASVLRPRLEIQTRSQVSYTPANPAPPVITLGKQLLPVDAPSSPMGYQVVVLENKNLIKPEGILLNRYYGIPTTAEPVVGYRNMYEEIARDLRAFPAGSVLILASFGLDADFGITPDMSIHGILVSAGAGPQLKQFESNPDQGSQGPYWVTNPANYILVGIINNGPNSGIELFAPRVQNETTVNADLAVDFYRSSFDTTYTLGPGIDG